MAHAHSAPQPKQIQAADLRNHLGNYLLAANPAFTYLPYQQRIIVPALHDIERGEIDRLVILMPPGAAKSRTLSQGFIPWFLGRHPERSLFFASYADVLAKRTGIETKLALESKLFQQLFPRCRMTKISRASDFFTLTAGGSFNSAGFDGSISGFRTTGMIIDDPIKNRAEAESLAVEEHVMEIYKGVLRQRLPLTGGGWILVATTRWCHGDFFERLMELEGEVRDGGIWYVIRLPAIAGEKDPFGRKAGEYLIDTPDFKARCATEQKDPTNWSALFQQDPQTATGPWFDESWLRFYDGLIKPGRFPCYMICDPALSKEKQNDRTSIMVLAAGPERRVFLVDWVLDRLDPGERTQAILNLIVKWRPVRFIYEEYGLMADTYHLRQEMDRTGIRCYPIPVGRKGPRHMLSKEARIGEIIPDFRDERIWLPKALPRRLANGETMDLIEYFRNEEFIPYAGKNSVAHDEGLDTLARIHEPELAMQHSAAYLQTNDNDDDYRRAGSQNTSWEGVY